MSSRATLLVGAAGVRGLATVAIVAAAIALASCTDDPVDRPATWAYLHPAIIAPSCATSSCHSERVRTADIRLDDADAGYAALIDRGFVVPGDPASTLLFLVTGEERGLMPPDAPLPAGDVALLRRWIEEGAPR